MTSYRVLKVFGLAILSMVFLVLLSFVEVAVYSMIIHPGEDPSFYETHATQSAPWVSGIGGFFLFFFVVRFWAKRSFVNLSQLAWLYPTMYVVLDIGVLLGVGGIDWTTFYVTFLLANGGKFLGSFVSYRMYS